MTSPVNLIRDDIGTYDLKLANSGDLTTREVSEVEPLVIDRPMIVTRDHKELVEPVEQRQRDRRVNSRRQNNEPCLYDTRSKRDRRRELRRQSDIGLYNSDADSIEIVVPRGIDTVI